MTAPRAEKIGEIICRPSEFIDKGDYWLIRLTGMNGSDQAKVSKIRGTITVKSNDHSDFPERKSFRLVIYKDPTIEDFLPSDAEADESDTD